MMNTKPYDFNNISMVGRFAYSVMCAERYAVIKYPDKNWKPLFAWMWKGTSEYFDEWYYRFSEILPEYLYEFDNYKDSGFEYLSEEDYDYYSAFLKGIDRNMEVLLSIPAEISMIYCYTTIPGTGKESIDLVKKSIKILKDNRIELPDPELVAFSRFSEKNGWGNDFEGRELSIVLN